MLQNLICQKTTNYLKSFKELFEKVKILFWFSLPLLMSQISLMLMSTTDNIMTSQQGILVTKTVGAANAIYTTFYVTLMAFLFALTPLISRDVGAKKNLAPWWIQGGWLVSLVSLVGFIILSDVEWIFSIQKLNLPKNLYLPVQDYLNIMRYSLVFGLSFKLFCIFNTALNRVKLLICIYTIALGINYALNCYFLPRHGAIGLAMAHNILNGLLLLTAVGFIIFDKFYKTNQKNTKTEDLQYIWDWSALKKAKEWLPKLEYVKKIMQFGIPVFASMAIEVGCFTMMSLLMVQYSGILMNSHQNINSIITTLYIVPLVIGTAINIKVSQSIGAKKLKVANEFAVAGVVLGMLWILVSVFVLYVLSDFIFQLYLPKIDAQSNKLLIENTNLVLFYMKQLLPWLLLVQLLDVIQTVFARILQAFGINNTQFIVYFIGLWGFGLGLGYYWNNHFGVSVLHYWQSMAIGLGFVTLVFGIMLKKVL